MAENDTDAPVTLRDTVEAAFDEHVPDETAAPVTETPAVEAVTDDRPRGPDGKFIPKEAAPEKPPAEPVIEAAPQVRPKPPSSWKKDYHPDWDALAEGKPLTPERALALLNYNLEREGQFASGVSTYKAEVDRLKPLADAIAPFLPALQQHNIDPGQWINNLGRAHECLLQAHLSRNWGCS